VCGWPLCSGWFRWRPVCADDGLWETVELAGGGGWLLWRLICGETKGLSCGSVGAGLQRRRMEVVAEGEGGLSGALWFLWFLASKEKGGRRSVRRESMRDLFCREDGDERSRWLKFQPASGWSGENGEDGDDDGEMALLLLVKGGGQRLVFFLLMSEE